MNSGMQKPPLAPKPKLAVPQRRNARHPSPGTPKRVKPALAPKPCLSKLSTASESKPLFTTTLQQISMSEKSEIPRTLGLLNSKNGIQQDNKKPDWDYTIPICLCSDGKCQCLGNTTDKVIDKIENDCKTYESRKPVRRFRGALDNRGEKTDSTNCQVMNSKPLPGVCIQVASTHNFLSNHKPFHHTPAQNKLAETSNLNLNPDVDKTSSVVTSLPHRTWRDEMNGNFTCPSEQGAEEDSIGSNHVFGECHSDRASVPAAPRKPLPVPVPWKPRKIAMTRQEKVVEEEREMSVKEVKVSPERMSWPSASINVPVPVENAPVSKSKQPPSLPSRKPCPPPAPPPRKKPFLSTPERTPKHPAAHHLPPQNVVGEELRGEDGFYEMEFSVAKEARKAEEGRDEQDAFYSELEQSPPSASLRTQPELGCRSALAVATGGRSEEDGAVKVAPKKPQRQISSVVWRLKKEASEEMEEERSTENEEKPELPSTPGKKTAKSPFPILQRAKSLSSADITHSQKRTPFQRLLDLKLSVKMLPKLKGKGGQTPNCATTEIEQCVDGDHDFHEHLNVLTWHDRKSSCPDIGLEQNVDGDEFYPGTKQAVDYKKVPIYEEIPDYINLPAGTAVMPHQTAWKNFMYADENIYEEQEPYAPTEELSGHRQKHSSSERDSFDEEAARPDDGPSDDDSWDDDSSSTSSKGDYGQQEVDSGPKKSKIHHITAEIMSSEKVFVDVLKLLHIDFRDAVSKASRQSGKPVIEERLLNQILYYLPQLYELNQDLLRELEQRVAKWDENAKLADIFVKKGPYLKMYSTYIQEFSKNVALLDEQSKKNSAFAGVVREFEASPRCAHLALRHYLLKPVQRLPQYQLLLTAYLKNLPPDSADHKDTHAAISIVKEVANHANDMMKQGDNFQKLIQVQCNLNGNHEIVQPGRVFLKEGILMKLSRKVMQPRMFFLFNDTLLYTTPVKSGHSGQYKLNNMLSLAGMKVSKPSREAYQNALNIESVERSFILSASSATEGDEWLKAIAMAISDYTRKMITLGKAPEEIELRDDDSEAPLGSKAPIWIPDPQATMCMICTCEFTLTWRRHHCRACGKVVCQACSSNKHCLEYLKILKNQLVRVCDQCVLVLQQQRSTDEQALSPSPGKSGFPFTRKQKKIPAALKEVLANTGENSICGYLQRLKGNRKQGKRLWFVIKDKVLYTYAASEDVAALESQPLLGFMLTEDSSQQSQFKLYHKNTLHYIFKADDIQTAQRWIESFKEATVL